MDAFGVPMTVREWAAGALASGSLAIWVLVIRAAEPPERRPPPIDRLFYVMAPSAILMWPLAVALLALLGLFAVARALQAVVKSALGGDRSA